ncbi:cysteine dioxygenase [Bordetella sp. N]|uniref:cysteine dioxygenase family protein n=1 Tax=Bordetella sp. N TaxID=1746199 RepID=UPI000708C3AA|nr:cysteine dioxygenase [Bordetella sp. N]ALM82732.1 cysteine dioxygenase [Bordetella sp. N]
MKNLEDQPAFRAFVERVSDAVGREGTQRLLLEEVGDAARVLVATDEWLPQAATVPHPQYYQQYLLYCDPDERFTVVSFVWGLGQSTPIHDHMTWGVIAMLRGAETGERYALGELASGGPMQKQEEAVLRPGDIEFVSPEVGDIHKVSNACADQVSISIHTYGGNIGRISRHVYDAASGQPREFISGYANADAATRGYGRFA